MTPRRKWISYGLLLLWTNIPTQIRQNHPGAMTQPLESLLMLAIRETHLSPMQVPHQPNQILSTML
jgi:hypothetical protein